MKTFILSIIFLFYYIPFLYSQNWEWATSVGGTDTEGSGDIVTDLVGNIYVTGSFSGIVSIDNITLISAGFKDFFLLKYDQNGNIIWAKSAGGTNNDSGFSIVTDALGCIYVTGSFNSPTLIFDNYTLANSGASDVFIVKYDSSGNVIWAKCAGGIYDDWGTKIITDLNGNIYLTGVFNSPSINFGLTNLINSSSLKSDFFIVKFDTSGNEIWAKKGGGTENDGGYSIVKDMDGNIYVTGAFESNPIIFGNISLTNFGFFDIFVVKLDSSGSFIWAKSYGGLEEDRSVSLVSDQYSNIYLTGYFNSQLINFDSQILLNANSGTSEIFIAKLDSSGIILWVKTGGGIYMDTGIDISINSQGTIYLSGEFDSPILTLDTFIINNSGDFDIFIARLDTSGNLFSVTSIGGLYHDYNSGITIDNVDNVYIIGSYSSPAITLGDSTFNNSGSYDIFIGKLSYVTGISEYNSYFASLITYPNPTSDKLYFFYSGFEKIKSIQVIDFIGKIVQSETNFLNNFISTKNLENGIYLMKISDGEKSATRKFIIQH